MPEPEIVGTREVEDDRSVFASMIVPGRISLIIAKGEPVRRPDGTTEADMMAEIRMPATKYRAWLKAQLHWLEQQSPETTTRARGAVQKRRKR